ncbi:winged helix-turn-helix domain-containing protein [Streptomyces sp. AP-93]|uniref:winged helix-turn-helix domain-containing protein n=1 Tax=Streptomyces sp. AP-93 TaxID=2929048 RepID=UPI001FAECED9|nr:winged helix-turn-helix domain-containing protein [Streptomyces sp. AP-93]MCJ0869364.1 winged helix-turn-helix domain-containing protein [Streptomyces sp. AP-93]
MPSPSRGGGPAAMPKYQRIAAALRREIDLTALTPGARLPSERSLAARYEVNRQTIRAALQHLREDGLVVTGRRGTRPAFPVPEHRPPAAFQAGHPAQAPNPAPNPALVPPPPAPAAVAAPAPAATPTPTPAGAPAQAWLTLVTLAPALAEQLGMRGGEQTLVHHHRESGPTGQTRRHAVTYLCPRTVVRTPELSRYRDRLVAGVRDEDLGPLHHWLEGAARAGRVAETITMTRTNSPQAATPAGGLSVRRTLHDASGRLLAVTDLAFPTWDRLTFDRSPAAIGFRVT